MIFLGIDCGTQSTKTIALDWDTGEVLASAQKAYGFVPNLPAGAMEQNPQDWVDAAEQSIGEVIAKLGSRKEEIRGIGVSGQQHGLVVLDKNDQVVRPAKLWNDTTTGEQCDQITEHFGGPNAVIALVGNTMRTGYTAPKILWLRQNEPENWKKTDSVLLPHDYLNFWLTGVKRMEFGDASGTALLDVETRQWSTKVVNYIAEDLPGKLPTLDSSRVAHGDLRKELCQKWGLSTPPVVSAGGGDNMMAAIGTGNIQPGWSRRASEPLELSSPFPQCPSSTRAARWLPFAIAPTTGCRLFARSISRWSPSISASFSGGTTRGWKRRSARCRPAAMDFFCSPISQASARPICLMGPAFFTV
jgi:xylulokinase